MNDKNSLDRRAIAIPMCSRQIRIYPTKYFFTLIEQHICTRPALRGRGWRHPVILMSVFIFDNGNMRVIEVDPLSLALDQRIVMTVGHALSLMYNKALQVINLSFICCI